MADDNQHIIIKIIAELSLPSGKEQIKRSAQLEAVVMRAVHKLGPILDTQFGKSFCRLDLLSIELNIQEGNLPHLAKLVEQTLVKKINQFDDKGSGGSKGANDNRQMMETLPPKKRTEELLVHFLQCGQLPWWAGRESMTEMEDWLLEVSSEQWMAFITPWVRRGNTIITKRLCEQFPNPLVCKLIKKSVGNTTESQKIIHLFHEMEQFLATVNITPGKHHHIITNLLKEALEGSLLEQSTQVVQSSLMAIAEAEIQSSQNNEETAASWAQWLKQSNSKYRRSWLTLLKNNLPTKPQREDHSKVNFTDDEQREATHKVEDKSDRSIKKDDGIRVINSGLVLLHPFMGRFFTSLGLTEDNDFTREATRERGVCVLHYLATGEEEFFEPELEIPKLLCNWPLEQPVNRFLPISGYEKDECDNVLNSVINHWGVLKNTSADGLRNSFLRREGILKSEEFGWTVHVERKTQDILLDKLPWGLSVVKFNWMDEMLTINWQ